MILEIKTKVDYTNKCGNCKYFKTEDHIMGKCVCLENQLRPWNRYRQYNSRVCMWKENTNGK